MLTTAGIIDGIFIAITAGGFVGLIISNFINPKKRLSKVIIYLATCGIFFLIASVGLSAEEINFNKGYCVWCGTRYQAVERHRSSTYYECPECRFGVWR